MFKKQPRSVDAIVADFDKTLTELQARQEHDRAELDKVQSDEEAAIREHNERMAALAEKRTAHTESHARAVRVHGKIADLLK